MAGSLQPKRSINLNEFGQLAGSDPLEPDSFAYEAAHEAMRRIEDEERSLKVTGQPYNPAWV